MKTQVDERLMDSGDLEKERGITILAVNLKFGKMYGLTSLIHPATPTLEVRSSAFLAWLTVLFF